MIASLVVALAAGTTFAQNYPMPGSSSAAPVVCTNCEGSNSSGELNKGLPTYPYRAPITKHVGRYVDSSTTLSIQHVGFRTARAGRVRFANQQRGSVPPRAYLRIGESVGSYTLPAFFNTVLPSALESVRSISTGTTIGGAGRDPLEKIQMFDSFIYPEAQTSGWKWQLYDAQHTLGDYDFDDRGMVYAAFQPYGWAIMKDGATNGTHMAMQWQDWEDKIIPQPFRIISIKSGSRYYVLVSDTSASKHMRWDVTDVTSPTAVTRTGTSFGFGAWSKYDAGSRLAYVGGDGLVHIWDYAELVSGGSEIISFAPTAGKDILDLGFDETGNLWVAESDYPKAGNNVLVKISPSGSTYVRQTFDVYGKKFSPQFIAVGGGFVAVAGTGTIYTGGSGLDVLLMKVQGGTPTKVDVDDFFTKYYHTAPSGYAQPPVDGGGYTRLQSGIALYKYEGKVYLFYSPFGLGDVFELEGSDSISLQMKTASFGTANPNSKATQTGPFPGDVVTFTAKSSNPSQTYAVNWDFGNPDSESLNYKASNTGIDVTHQFTGLQSASAIGSTKTVTASVSSDSTLSAALPVVLKVPEARIGFPNGANAWAGFTATTNGLKAVAGQVLTDASDGSVESHFSTWTLDGQDSKLKPHNTLNVGAIGAHTVKLTTSYGRYDSNFSITKPFNVSTGTLTYTVVPFLAKMNTPVKSGTNVTFSGTGIYTTDTAVLSATQWTVTWTLSGTGASAAATQSSTVPLGQIPNFVVPAPISPNSTVTLDVAVDPTKVNGPAQFASAQESQLLSTPDPKIVITGCEHANEACQFTAASIAGGSTADWGVTWTVKQGNTTLFTSSQNPYTPTFGTAGTYTVSLKVVKTVFEANATDKLLSVAAALCGPLPAQDLLTITSECDTGCAVNQLVKFIGNAVPYTHQDCDTWSWNFGDGTPVVSGRNVNHSFTTKKTYTVKVTVKNSTNTTGVTKQVQITVGGGVDPGDPGPTCIEPANIDFDWTCGNNCKTGDSVVFTARRGALALLSCDNTAWSFGDNSTSTNGRHTYSTPGTYQVSVVVSNSLGESTPVTKSITITASPDNNSCTIAPTEANFTVKYVGASSNCRDTNSTPCVKGENIAFTVGTFQYTIKGCDTLQWTFGDNSTPSNASAPTHAYNANGTSFEVQLKVTNGLGTATVKRSVSFGGTTNTEPAPTLTFENFPTSGQTGKAITFKVNSSHNATNWLWTFSDGTGDNNSNASQTGTSNTISHTFANKGTFSVRVQARNAAGAVGDTPGATINTITITEAPAVPTYKFMLPVVTHIGGQNNSSWRTDVQVYSQDPTISPSKPLTMSAVLRDMTRTLEIPSSTYIYEDFMRIFTTGNDSGPVVITVQSQYAPQIWTRTYNQTEAGTFGQFIPAIRIDEGGTGSSFGTGKYFLAGLRHDDRYRTNLGLVNPNSTAVPVTVTVWSDQGDKIGTFTRQLGSYQLDQFSILSPGALTSLPKDRPFSVEFEVPAGQWLIAYCSFIDGGSNDPVFIRAIRESDLSSEDLRTTIVPGVGHTGAWRSDVTVFNPYSRKVNVNMAYYDQTGAKKGEALNVPIDAGEFLQYDDLLKQGVFGSVADSLGMLMITVPSTEQPSQFPMATARTYNDDGSGRTFGQGIAGFAAPRANVKPGTAALIPAVRDNTKFYTNIGLTNTTGATVTVTVKLLDPATGQEVKAPTYTLAPYQSVVGQYTLEGRDNASLKIEATGNVWAFASIIDRSTKDPEYVSATPLP
ncbi:MAG TPA: PKD domain-containing protein [Thermoanaerobaculia bacterium]|nr:PKD domain-containing protein [Thermoanaerobaculia bacterium]